jgi:hypothetical protein
MLSMLVFLFIDTSGQRTRPCMHVLKISHANCKIIHVTLEFASKTVMVKTQKDKSKLLLLDYSIFIF